MLLYSTYGCSTVNNTRNKMPTIQKAQKKNKWAIWAALILISALCWIENAYFTEANNVEEARRKVLHIVFLVAIMLLGYWAWYKQPVKWPGKIWLMVYLLV